MKRKESIQKEVLEGVDSDDEVLDDLVRRAEEIHKAETTTNKRDRDE